MQTSIKAWLLLLVVYASAVNTENTPDIADAALNEHYEAKNFVQLNGRWYYFTDPYGTLFSIEESILLCQTNGMVLASIETEEEDLAIRGWLVDRGWGFIEGRGFRTSGRKIENLWMWTSTGQPFNHTGWTSGEPDDPTPDACVDIQGSVGWYDWTYVDHKMMAVCEQSG